MIPQKQREKTKKCKYCGKMFSPQGLYGHIKILHYLESQQEKAKKQPKQACAKLSAN